MKPKIKLDMDLNPNQVDAILNERCSAEPIVPELVTESEIREPNAYNRFRDLDIKQTFRKKLKASLAAAFEAQFGKQMVADFIGEFERLASELETHGAVIFGNMIQVQNFEKLIAEYSRKLSNDGSKSWIHTYLNFGNHPDFLTDADFSGAFVHPLLVCLMAYSAGGPMRMVDARGKDAEPLAVQAQDNMLHIDNTPFRKEYKVILTWERGKPSGPKGQNFVFIPGTHKGVRNCQVNSDGMAWSTEDGSIFITNDAIQTVFDVQEKMLPGRSPVVVEASHPDMPLTTVFEAGALVHHRYRTKEKNVPRSCVIVAFHRALDNPGQFLSEEYLNKVADEGSLSHLLMGSHANNTEDKFIHALVNNIAVLADKMTELSSLEARATKIVPYAARLLDKSELEKWKAVVTAAPTVEAIKAKEIPFELGKALSHELLSEMMKYDKHGPLDLILYGDGREEIRKWARNRIREMPLARLNERLLQFADWELKEEPTVE